MSIYNDFADPGSPYTDTENAFVTVTFAGRERRVHLNIVSSQSTFFSKAFGSGMFKEGSSATINLIQHPALIERMLQFFYQRGYPDELSSDDEVTAEDDGLIVAVPAMKHGKINIGWLHAAMYGIGDFYGIPLLKQHCTTAFEGWAGSNVADALDVAVVNEVYQRTPDEDRALRDLLVTIGIKDRTITRQFGEEAIRTVHGFATDVALEICNTKEQPVTDTLEFKRELNRHTHSVMRRTVDLMINRRECRKCKKTFWSDVALRQHKRAKRH